MRNASRFLLVILILAAPASARAQLPPDAMGRVDQVFARYANDDSPGCAVGVSLDGKRVLERAYGMADLEHGIRATAANIYEAGSVSKQFTAAAIVLLALDGKLSFDDDIRKYLPEIPDYGTPITIRHLLNHTSGLRDWGSVAAISGWGRSSRVHTHDHVLEIVARQRALNYAPGAAYSYTNSGYNLLAIIVDRTSGMSFADFSRTRIFEPLGLKNTQWRDDYTRLVPGRATAYSDRRGGGFSINMPIENVHGNGGLLTTVGDLLTWTEAIHTGKLGGPRFVSEMHRQGILTSGREISYASGLQVGSYNGVPQVSHTGSTAGYRAFLARYPEQRVAVALLCNVASASPGGLGNPVADVFLPRRTAATGAAAARQAPAGITLPEAELRGKAGLYSSTSTGEAMRITYSDGALRADRGGVLQPLSRTVFRLGTGTRRFTFDAAGSNGRGRIRETGGDEDVVWVPVDEFAPTEAELAAYVGEYYSPDADVTFTATIQDGRLVLLRSPSTRMQLTPVYRDVFNASSGMFRFHRDASGRITELGIRQDRVWDLRFTRR